MSTLLAIDGTNLLYRTYHALEPTSRGTTSGQEHWVVGGFVDSVARLILLHRPSSVVVALDGEGGCPARKALAPAYKAGRATTPEKLVEELRASAEILSALGLSTREVFEWEADDVLASLAAQASAAGAKSVVVTSDKDGHQLVAPGVSVYKPEGVMVSDEWLEAKYQVTGDRWVEFAAMVGEKSDNLPGVEGIGPKRAALVVAACKDVEEILGGVGREVLGERLHDMMLSGAETLRRNRQVATLRRDLEIDISGINLGRFSPEACEAAGSAWGIERSARNLVRAITQVRSQLISGS